MIRALLLLAVLGLSGCGPRTLLNMSKKLLDKAIEKGAVVTADTVWHEVTLTTEPVHVEYEPKLVQNDDTVYYARYIKGFSDSVRLKIIYKEGKATPVIDIPSRSEQKEVPVTVNQDIKAPPRRNNWKWFVAGVILGMAGAVFLFRR